MTDIDKVTELRQQLPDGWVIVPRYWVLSYETYYPCAWNVLRTTPDKNIADELAWSCEGRYENGVVIDLVTDAPEVLNGEYNDQQTG